MRRWYLAAATSIAVAATTGCSDDSTEPDGVGGAGAAGGSAGDCVAGEFEHPGGGCCPAGTTPAPDGTCTDVGVAPEGCREGFLFDATLGCVPILPADPCEPGRIAAPGQSTCAAIAACGSERFGEIPRTADCQHVDAAYAGTDSDGSEEHPWKTIQQAIDAAGDGGQVAVAAGSYVENLAIEGKSLTLWGRCPELVEVVGVEASPALGAIVVGDGADTTQLRGIAVTGERRGVYLWGAREVELDSLWIHDTADHGLVVADRSDVSGQARLRASLIEGAVKAGVFVRGSELVVEGSVIRDTKASSSLSAARGIIVQPYADTERPASLLVRDSLVERNGEIGVFVAGAEATLEGVVVRDTECTADGIAGRGVAVQAHPDLQWRSTLAISGSVLEGNRELGISIGSSDATIDHTVVRATRANGHVSNGWGMALQLDPALPEPATLAIDHSLIEGNREVGIGVSGSDILVERTIIRGTRSDVATSAGMGMHVQADPDTGQRPTATVRQSRIEENQQTGITMLFGDATIEASVVRATGASWDDTWGDGLTPIATPDSPCHVTVESSRIEDHPRAGISSFGATVDLLHTALLCNAISLDAERDFVVDGQSVSSPAAFEDRGGNVCRCGDEGAEACQVSTSGIAAPDPPAAPPGA